MVVKSPTFRKSITSPTQNFVFRSFFLPGLGKYRKVNYEFCRATSKLLVCVPRGWLKLMDFLTATWLVFQVEVLKIKSKSLEKNDGTWAPDPLYPLLFGVRGSSLGGEHVKLEGHVLTKLHLVSRGSWRVNLSVSCGFNELLGINGTREWYRSNHPYLRYLHGLRNEFRLVT